MKKLLTRIIGAIAGFAMVIGVGFAVANHKEDIEPVHAAIDPNTEAVAFTLTAKYNNSNSDSGTEITTGPNNLFSNGSTYLSAATSSKVYLGASSAAALKFGSSSARGTMNLTLKSGAQDTTYMPTKVIFSIAAANDVSKKVKLSLNGASSGTGFSQITYGGTAKQFADYEVAWDGTTTLTSIGVQAVNASSNRFYLKSITVVVSSVASHDVSFNSLGGGSFDSIQVNEGNAVGTLPTPSKPKDEENQKRYEFLGWYALSNTDNPSNPTFEGATEYTASSVINSDVTLYAKYQVSDYYKVIFDSRGGSAVATQEVDAGEKASTPAAPTKETDLNYSYTFSGWYRESSCENAYDFNDSVNTNITLFAKWNETPLLAKQVVAMKETSSSLAYSDYHKNVNTTTDTLTRAFTGVSVGTSYGNWSDKAGASGIKYAGNSAGSNDTLQLRSSDNAGIIVTDNDAGLLVKSITLKWNNSTQATRTIQIYGKAAAYSATSDLYNSNTDGDLIVELCIDNATNNELSYEFESDYQFIGIKSKSGAQYLNSIDIEWETISYTYDNLAIRFTGSVEEELWDRLHSESTITGYGMLLAEYETIKDDPQLKNWYEYADLYDNDDLKNFDNSNTVHDPALKPAPTLKNGYYVWNLFKTVSLENATKDYVAVAYIKLANDELVFLQQERISVKKLAQNLIAGPERDENSLGGSLNYLANL